MAPQAGTAVAIGNFDGVHLGHRAVLARLDAVAGALGLSRCVYTFHPAPTAVVAPERHQPRIQTLRDRVATLRAAGVDHVVVEPFTAAFAAIPAERFAAEYLRARLRARALVIGHDFRFGNMRGGDAERLRAWLPDVQIMEVAACLHGDHPVSSSRVRKLIAAGEVEDAATLLGRAPSVSGPIVHGEARGRTLGFPTANVAVEEELRPGHGVYAARVWHAGNEHPAAVNVGIRPTVGGMRFTVEAHLLDFEGDLYGARVEVRFLRRLRGEQRFASFDALKAQIAADVQAARAVLA